MDADDIDKPQCAQRRPYVVEVEEGTYAWCSCGRSQKQPYCDGSHVGTAFSPYIHRHSEKGKVAWCGCKHSKNPPFCDGSHSEL